MSLRTLLICCYLAMAGPVVCAEWKQVSLADALLIACHPDDSLTPPGCQTSKRLWSIRGGEWFRAYKYADSDYAEWKKLLQNDSANLYGRMCAAYFIARTDESAREFLFKCASASEPRHRMNAADLLVVLHYSIADQPDWIMPRLSVLALEGKFDPVEERFDPGRRWPEKDENDHRHDVYSRMCYRLPYWKDPRAVDVLVRCFEKEIGVDSAARALEIINDKRGLPPMLAWLRARKAPQDEVVRALGTLGCKEATDELRSRLVVKRSEGMPYLGSREEVILALRDLGAKEAVPDIELFMVEYIKDRETDADPLVVRARTDTTELACRRALAVLKDADPVASLLQMLNTESDPFRRGDIIADLARLNDARVEKALVQLAQNDSNLNVRWRALWGLARMKTQSSLLLVVSHLEFKFPPLKEGLPRGVRHQTDDDATAFMHEKIVEMLKQTTGQKFGQDRAVWEKWIQEEFPKSVSAKQ